MAVQNNVITSTDYLAVVDKFYKPKENEKIVELLGRRLLIKNQKALDNYSDMAAFYQRFMNEIYNPVRNTLYKDPHASIINYKFKAIDLVCDIAEKVNEKRRKRPTNKNIDFSNIDFEIIYKKVSGKDLKEGLVVYFSIYEMEIGEPGLSGERIKKEINSFLLNLRDDFEMISCVYSYCLREYGYDTFTVAEIDKNMDIDESPLDMEEQLIYDITKGDEFSDDTIDKEISLICVNPYFRGGWVFVNLAMTLGDRKREIYRAVCDLYPELGKNWDREMLSMIDDKYEIPYSRDKVELKKALILLEEKMSDDHKELGLPESVVSPKLQEVRAKIRELSSDITHDEHLQQYYEEERKTSKYSPKSKSVAMLLLFVGGIFGAHKFYEGRKKMGILYFFTMGLLFIGLIMDFIVLYEMPSTYIPGQKYSE